MKLDEIKDFQQQIAYKNSGNYELRESFIGKNKEFFFLKKVYFIKWSLGSMEASLKIKLLNIQPRLGVREQELAASGEAEEHVAGGEGGVRHLHRILSEKYIPSLSPLLSSSIQYSFGWKT